MQLRPLLRILATALILTLLWMRTLGHRHSSSWVWGLSALSVLLLGAVAVQVSQIVRGGRRPKDEVPKRPLGLE